jgi:small ligand-binding sensory domain FIST
VTVPAAPFTYSHAADAEWPVLVARCAEDLGPGNLGFLYVTDALAGDLDGILERLRHLTGVEDWVGTVGIGICATGKEYYNRPAMAAMVGDFPPGSYRLFPPVSENLSAFREGIEGWRYAHSPYLALVHGDPSTPGIQETVEQLAGEMETGFLVGGLASSRGDSVVVANRAAAGGVSGVVFSDQVGVVTRLSQGCSPIGPVRRVDESRNNVMLRIDHRPALEAFKEDIGEVLAREIEKVGGYIFAALPIPGSDTADYLVRNLGGFDPESGALAIGDLVGPGQAVMFCRRDGDSAREDLVRMLGELKRALRGKAPRGGVYVSCLGRGEGLFGPDSAELNLIREHLGDFPLVGFYANGEISRDRLYGYTGVLTLFT